MTSHRRETIWLGSDEDDDDLSEYDISTEDDMVSVSCIRNDGSELEVFICRTLFSRIREKMDVIEGRDGG